MSKTTEEVESVTADLRVDDLKAANSFVKPAQKLNAEEFFVANKQTGAVFPDDPDLLAAAKILSKATPEQLKSLNATPEIDFSKLNMEDVYDLSILIEAKPFMSADVLAVKLKDTNYVARWVNKNSQNLGDKIAKGFTYIVSQDLYGADAIQTSLDAQGHYCFHDVVAMKIDKATYFRALRAAYERAILTTDQSNTRKRAANVAHDFMGQTRDYNQVASEGKMRFYNPDVGV